MPTLKLFLAEITYRKVNFLLSLAAVVLAVTLFVASPILVEAYQRETQSQVDQWQSRVAELEDQVTAMRSGIGKVEKETPAELARLEDETRRLMRDMGFNLMVTHRGTNMSGWYPDYFFHKGGVINFTRFIASYYGGRGVRCNCVSPGGFRTSDHPEPFVRQYSDRTFLGRLANSTDLMGVIVFLSSDASLYITGTNIPVDGGYTAK